MMSLWQDRGATCSLLDKTSAAKNSLLFGRVFKSKDDTVIKGVIVGRNNLESGVFTIKEYKENRKLNLLRPFFNSSTKIIADVDTEYYPDYLPFTWIEAKNTKKFNVITFKRFVIFPIESPNYTSEEDAETNGWQGTCKCKNGETLNSGGKATSEKCEPSCKKLYNNPSSEEEDAQTCIATHDNLFVGKRVSCSDKKCNSNDSILSGCFFRLRIEYMRTMGVDSD